ncbi:MAG: sulfatase [Bacteroidales bacterium]
MNLRTIGLLSTGVAASLTTCKTGKVADEKSDKPNIIFIMTDDHAYQALSAYGSVLNETPNLDRLANEGMIFENAFVTNSISAPSRAVILTGKFSHHNGLIDNRIAFDSTQVTYPKLLRNAGYTTAMIGKWHLKTQPTGFDYWKVLPGQGYYYNPDFRTPQGMEQIQGYVTDIITDVAIDWLKGKRDPEKPFMLMYQHKAPHRPWWPAPRHFKEWSQKTFPEPETLFDDYEDRGEAAKTAEMNLLYHMQYGHDSKIRPETIEAMGGVEPDVPDFDWGFTGPYGRTNDAQKEIIDPVLDSINNYFMENWPKMTDEEKMKWKYQRYMQDYLACIHAVDENIGRLLDYLDESGLAENTVIVYTSDQGFYLGEHGWFDKRFMYEESLRTPLIIKWPGVTQPGSMAKELVQNLDFAQTLLEIAGVESPGDMQGKSIVPVLKGDHENEWRNALYYHYYEYPAVHMVKRHYGIRTHRYKLIHFYYDVDEWELYDLEKDPSEMNNVYDNPDYQDIVSDLKMQLHGLREKYGDADSLSREYFYERYGFSYDW